MFMLAILSCALFFPYADSNLTFISSSQNKSLAMVELYFDSTSRCGIRKIYDREKPLGHSEKSGYNFCLVVR